MNQPIYELTDSQWQLIEKIVDHKRQRDHSLRTIVNAILSVNRTGVQWRELDSKYPPGRVFITTSASSSCGVFGRAAL